MKVGSLFSGIGGLDLGLERAGMEIVWQIEIDEWCRRVLAKHWPNVRRYGDIKEVSGHELQAVDLICGGFPCQPVSVAGQRRGTDDRRWLWPEMARLIGVLRPRYVLVENVPGLFARGIDDVLGGLAESGYHAEWDRLSAAAFGAPHIRDRVFIVAYSERDRLEGGQSTEGSQTTKRRRFAEPSDAMADTDEPGSQGRERGVLQERPRKQPIGEGGALVADAADNGQPRSGGTRAGRARLADGGDWIEVFRENRRRPIRESDWTVEPDVGRVAHGVPARVDRLRGLGNAVVPQVAEWLGRRIMAIEAAAK